MKISIAMLCGALAVLLPALVQDYGTRMIAAIFAFLVLVPLSMILAQRDGMDHIRKKRGEKQP